MIFGDYVWLILLFFDFIHSLPFSAILSKKVSLDRLHWQKVGMEDLQQALYKDVNMEMVENIIVFVGDGMGPETVTAARAYVHSDMGFLSFEKFPFTGTLKTYSADTLTPDTGSAGTAFFCGTKSNRGTVGLHESVKYNDCLNSINTKTHLHSIFEYAEHFGKATGFVTTGRVTHGTVTALYAHSANVDWECDGKVTRRHRRCKDIAKQLIQNEPGKNIKVIMGGGRQCLQSKVVGTESDPIDHNVCYSRDGRDLIREWVKDKHDRGLNYATASNNLELERVMLSKAEYVLGIFANSDIKYNYARERGSYGMPSLSKMAEKAIHVLYKYKGFLLVVENALIDKAHHQGHARIALDETGVLSTAVADVVRITEELRIAKKTLIIVTGSFAHSLVISGYPNRAGGILGIADKSPVNELPYTTLMYTTGGRKNFQFYTDNSNFSTQVKIVPYYGRTAQYSKKIQVLHCPQQQIYRQDPLYNDIDSFTYSQQAFILTDEVHHSGTDVTIYAKGPHSHYFHRTHDSTYLFHVINFAMQSESERNRNMPYSVYSGVSVANTFKVKSFLHIFVLLFLCKLLNHYLI